MPHTTHRHGIAHTVSTQAHAPEAESSADVAASLCPVAPAALRFSKPLLEPVNHEVPMSAYLHAPCVYMVMMPQSKHIASHAWSGLTQSGTHTDIIIIIMEGWMDAL
jgi:hypothetical protein